MKKYLMLDKIDEARVSEVGGKAAILEELVKRHPKRDIPEFKINQHSSIGYKDRIFRASSDLDVFGGCGLHETFTDVAWDNSSRAFKDITEPESLRRHRINLFAKSIGREYKKPVVISQEQRKPYCWAVVMQHPNNPDYLLIAYSDSPSSECKPAPLEIQGKIWRGQNLYQYARDTYFAVCDSSFNIEGKLRTELDRDIIQMAAVNHLEMQELGIVSNEWVSISEVGFAKGDNIETYQFTPIRKRTYSATKVLKDKLVFGVSEPKNLPVVNIPDFISVESCVGIEDTKGKLGKWPDFDIFVHKFRKERGCGVIEITGIPAEILIWEYMNKIENRYPKGYLVIAEQYKQQEFDVTMRNAAAVLLHSANPLTALNHNASRLIAKAPVLIVDNEIKTIPTGEHVKFSCDGTNYSLD